MRGGREGSLMVVPQLVVFNTLPYHVKDRRFTEYRDALGYEAWAIRVLELRTRRRNRLLAKALRTVS